MAKRISPVALRPYQLEALDIIDARWQAGITRQLVQLPTGTGKTVVFAEAIRRRRGRALVVAHREELLAQAAEKIRDAAPDLTVGIVKAERDEHDTDVTVASIQTLAHTRRLERLTGPYKTVVVDEAHHAAAESYARVIAHTVRDGTLLLGVTATPGRGDGVGLDGAFAEVVYSRSVVEMIAGGYLVDLRALQVEVEGLDLSRVAVRRGDFADGQLAEMLAAAHLPRVIADAWSKHAKGRKGLVFTPSVALAHETAEVLAAAGTPAAAIDGTTHPDRRAETLRQFGTGELQVVTNCAVLTEGFDEPTVDCIVIARPTKSQGLYLQCVGRGTRLSPGKTDCLIIDLVGSTKAHDLVTLADLAGLDPFDLAQRGAAEILADAPPEMAVAGTWAGELIAHNVDLFRRRPMAWVKSGPNWILSTGAGFVALLPRAGRWDVVDRPRQPPDPTTLARGLTLEWAQGLAEDVIRKRGAALLTRTDAPWRARQASDRQTATLRGMRIPHSHSLTAGEASDLIAARLAKRAS